LIPCALDPLQPRLRALSVFTREIGLLVVGLAVGHDLSKRVAKRYPQPELAPG
jgi:hypothetical protein